MITNGSPSCLEQDGLKAGIQSKPIYEMIVFPQKFFER